MLSPVAMLSARHPAQRTPHVFARPFFNVSGPPIADVGDIILTLTRDQTLIAHGLAWGPPKGWTPTPTAPHVARHVLASERQRLRGMCFHLTPDQMSPFTTQAERRGDYLRAQPVTSSECDLPSSPFACKLRIEQSPTIEHGAGDAEEAINNRA
jgi:hypothetical protein